MNEWSAQTKPLCLVLYSEVAEHFISFFTCSELCPPFLTLFDESLSDLSEFPFIVLFNRLWGKKIHFNEHN